MFARCTFRPGSLDKSLLWPVDLCVEEVRERFVLFRQYLRVWLIVVVYVIGLVFRFKKYVYISKFGVDADELY